MGERIGVFGGTFDPVHTGHLVAAVNARDQLRLDRVLLVVANRPWQKQGRRLSPAEDRLALVEAVTQGVDGLEASRMEIDRGGLSYTADTLAALDADRPGDTLFLILGVDVAAELDTWERVDEIKGLATLAVVDRPGTDQPALPDGWRVERVEIPHLDISSSDIRARIAAGRPIEGLVPDAAILSIRARRLYAGGR